MSFLKKLFGSSPAATPAYTDFEAGDIFYTPVNGMYHFFKVLHVDDETHTLHVLLYEEMSAVPPVDQAGQFKVRVYHAPVDKSGFANAQLFLKTPVQDSDLMGYHEYIKQTRNVVAIVSQAKKYYQEAYALTTSGHHHEAIKKYTIAIDLLPNFFEAIDNRAFCKMDLGLLLEAIADFQHSLAVNPGSLLPVFSIGECYLKMGDLEHAKTFFEQAVAISPDHEKPREMLALTLRLMGNNDE